MLVSAPSRPQVRPQVRTQSFLFLNSLASPLECVLEYITLLVHLRLRSSVFEQNRFAPVPFSTGRSMGTRVEALSRPCGFVAPRSRGLSESRSHSELKTPRSQACCHHSTSMAFGCGPWLIIAFARRIRLFVEYPWACQSK